MAKNYELPIVEKIKEKFKNIICLRRIASVLSLFIGEYIIVKQKWNFYIV